MANKAGFNAGYNVKQWKSPYAHRAECKKAKIQNIQQSKLYNQEKSVNTANNTSIFFTDNHNKEGKGFNAWAYTPIYQQHKLQEQYIKRSQMYYNYE